METDDQNFMSGMKELLGMEKEDVEKLLDTLDADTLMALTDAVSEGNKEEAERIISQDEDINDLFYKSDKKKKKHPVKPKPDHEYMYGDDVAVLTVYDDEKTGKKKKKFVSATVYKPNAPGNTVGVRIEGKPKMVEKDNLYVLEENVMGMIGIPNLQRMQQLAGIPMSEPENSSVTTTEIVPPADEPSFVPPIENSDCPVEKAMAALDVVAAALPDIRLADLKAIRQKIVDLQTKMNECFNPKNAPEGRSKKKV